MNGERKTNGDVWRFKLLSYSLVAILLSSLLLPPLLSALGNPIPDGKGDPLSFWLIWEILSVLVTAIVTIIFWYSYFWGGKNGAFMDGARARWGALAVPVLIIFALSFFIAGWTAFFKGSLAIQVSSLTLGVLATVAMEYLALNGLYDRLKKEHLNLKNFGNRDSKNECALTIRAKLGDRDNVTKYLCYSDVPIAIAIGVLSLFVVIYSLFGIETPEKELRAFVSGAVAIQLLYSNLVFWIESLAQTSRGEKTLNSLSRPLLAIHDMLLPEKRNLPRDLVSWANEELDRIFTESASEKGP